MAPKPAKHRHLWLHGICEANLQIPIPYDYVALEPVCRRQAL